VTAHVAAVPEQAPPQPPNVAPEAAFAVSTTAEFAGSFALQIVDPLPQSIPPPVTAPRPVTETASGKDEPVPPEKAADTVFGAFMVTVHVVGDPAHAPPQPLKPEPEPAVAVNVTVEPEGSLALQPEPPAEVHAMPPPVTVPLPVTVTVSGWVVAD
jgi:hypothetical protein